MMVKEFRMPSTCKMKEYHVFEFDTCDPGFMSMRKLTKYTDVKRVSLLGTEGMKKFQTFNWDSLMHDTAYAGVTTDIEKQD